MLMMVMVIAMAMKIVMVEVAEMLPPMFATPAMNMSYDGAQVVGDNGTSTLIWPCSVVGECAY